ncbi:MAG: protein phosphatase CheZ [Gammaproteobacteria bacterium]|nr:protein phosphatase CheZ [Gammaproteobacteria bacterium]
MIDELTTIREVKIFEEIGRLTRTMHESLRDLRGDPLVEKLATESIPNAKDRLSYVIELTEQSAHKSLQSVEAGLPIVDGIHTSIDKIQMKWQKFLTRDLSVDEFKSLVSDISFFIEDMKVKNKSLGGHFQDILMAQSFQDLSGQLIRQVIDIVNEAEDKLIDIVSVAGSDVGQKNEVSEPVKSNGFGPMVPNSKEDNRLKNQDEVDDLLSSLGF